MANLATLPSLTAWQYCSFSNCDEGDEILTPHDFDIFTEDWAKFDKEGSGYIAVEDLTTFIQVGLERHALHCSDCTPSHS